MSNGDDSDLDFDFIALDDHSSNASNESYSPVKRQYICHRMCLSSVPYAIPKGRGTSCSTSHGPKPGIDSESEDGVATLGIDRPQASVGGGNGGGGATGSQHDAPAQTETHTADSSDPGQSGVSTTLTQQPQLQPQPAYHIHYPPAN